MSKRHPLFYALILLATASFACTTVTNLFNSGNQPAASATPAAASSPQAGAETPQSTAIVEESRDPIGFMEWIQQGAEEGLWTREEGIIASLELLTGQRALDSMQLPVAMTIGEGTGLARAAFQFIERNPDSEEAQRMEELLGLMAPEEERIDRFSLPADQTGSRLPGLTRQLPQGNSAQCKNSWLDNFSGTEGAVYDCFEAHSERLSLSNSGSVEFKIYSPLAWSQDEEKSAYVQAAIEATKESLTEYDALGPVDDTTLYFSLLNVPESNAAASNADFGGIAMTTLAGFSQALQESCPIYIHPWGIEAEDIDDFKQSIAHEIFHCFQFWNLNSQSLGVAVSVNDWWVEGTAEYYSNVVYPCINNEHSSHADFADRSRENWLFDLSYDANIFFQHYANTSGGPSGLLSFLQGLPTTGGQEAQARALKAAGMEEEAFHQFGQTYLDGQIADSCQGSQIPAEGDLGVNDTFQLEEVGQLETRELESGPYTVARYALVMPAERRLLMELLEEDGQGKTSSRERQQRGQWDEFPDDVRTRCEEREIQITLVTTTELQPPTDYELKLEGETQQASCDGCLLGTWQVSNDSFEAYMERAFSSSGAGSDITFDVTDVRGQLLIGFNDEGEMKGQSDQFGLNLSVDTPGIGENFMSSNMDISLTGQATYAADGEIATVFSPQVTTGEQGTARFFDGTSQDISLELTLAEMFALTESLGGPGGQVPTENAVEYQCFDDEGRILWTIPELGTIEYLRTDETVFEDK